MIANDQKHRRERGRQSRWESFNAFVRALPEWVYWMSVFVIGAIAGGIYLLVSAL